MSETIVDTKLNLTSRIQQDYKSALERSSDVIGLDSHNILYQGTDVVNLITLDECCEILQCDARRSLLKILKGVELGAFNWDEVKAYIDGIRPDIKKYDSKKARSGLMLPEPNKKDSKISRINGNIILNEFYYSFNKELCDAYDTFGNQESK